MRIILPIFLLYIGIATENAEGRCAKRQVASSVPAASIAKRVVCYFSSWSIYRPEDQKFSADDINPNLCTHIIYAFAKVEKNQKGLAPFDSKVDVTLDGYNNFIGLKKRNPDLKLLLSAGGSREGSPWFSQIAGDPELRSQFVNNSVRFVREFKFDGLDIAWQWPGIWTGSSALDRDNYVLLVKEMREAITKESQESGLEELLLSIVTPKFEQEIIRGFDLTALSEYVDFFNIPAYDYHSALEPTVNHIAPIYNLPQEEYNKDFTLDSTVKAYAKLGVHLDKVNIGMPLYGINFIIADQNNTDIGAAADEEGEGQESGVLLYNQICKKVIDENWTVKYANRTAMGPYAFKNTNWVAYDDEESIKAKARYARERGIGGIMFWSVDMDDFRGNCHGITFPLIKAGLEAFVLTEPLKSIPITIVPIPLVSTEKPNVSTENVTPRTEKGVTQKSKPDTRAVTDKDNEEISLSLPRGFSQIKSQRDVIIQNFKLWVTNYYSQTPSSAKI